MVIVQTTKGNIKGVQESNYQRFFGIPFAKPPVGDLRFREPQPMEPWDDVKDASEFGSIAPQNQPDTPPIDQKENEDCLYLNVWTPAADDKARPVMVWIHGGGFLFGASSRPRNNGARLAVRSDVVVVNFNYRLGAFGFLNLSGIPPNIGIQDQIAALNWVQENIERFGGDPNNVTIFGESAGASSVAILLAIPAASGLFHKAIMESGSASPRDYGADKTRKGAEEFVSKLEIEKGNINALREVSIKKIMRVQKKLAGSLGQIIDVPFQPFIDGKIIPEHPLETMRKGKASYVPIIIGSNKDELGFISILLSQANENTVKPIMDNIHKRIQDIGIEKKKMDLLIDIYKKEMQKEYPNKSFKYLDALLSDFIFSIPIIRTLEAYANHQPNSYCYIFTHGSRVNNMALHTIEIPFVFGNLDTRDIADGGIKTGEGAEEVAKNVMDAWVAFARTGNPNHEGLPEWPPYDLKKRPTMMLGVNSKVEDDPMGALRKAWNYIL